MSSTYLDLEEEEQKGIPTFLKVLCILTFIGAGFGIIGAIYSVAMHDFTMNMMSRSLESAQNNPFMPKNFNATYMETLEKWGMVSYGLNFLGSFLCLMGAIFMWKLKKSGFYVYVLGQIVPFIAAYGLLGGMTAGGGTFGGLMLAGQILGALFPIGFIVMYAVNLKHLK